MLVSELVENIKIEAGQFEIDFEELSTAQYAKILERSVAPIVAKHIPYKSQQRVEISASPYTFTSNIPDWISEVIPIDLISIENVLSEVGIDTVIAEATTKPTFLWQYNSPNLYVEYTGTFNILSCHKLELQASSPDDYEILYMDDNALPYIIDLTAGYAMKAMGRSRRAATLTELPFTLDTDSLASDGKELVESTIERLKQASQWWLSV